MSPLKGNNTTTCSRLNERGIGQGLSGIQVWATRVDVVWQDAIDTCLECPLDNCTLDGEEITRSRR